MTRTCPRGHAVVGDNALRRNHLGKKWVECRACRNTANRDYQRATRANRRAVAKPPEQSDQQAAGARNEILVGHLAAVETLTVPEICAHTGLSRQTVTRHLKAMEIVPTRKPGRPKKTRETQQRRADLAARSADFPTQRAAAEYYGVSVSCIGLDCRILGIRIGRSYKRTAS